MIFKFCSDGIKLTGADSWCETLSQLVANEDCSISYMSASLIFEIYIKEQADRRKSKEQTDERKSTLVSKVNVECMTDEHLLLVKKMLLNDKNSRKDIINFLNSFTSQDNSEPNVAPDTVASVYNSGECAYKCLIILITIII